MGQRVPHLERVSNRHSRLAVEAVRERGLVDLIAELRHTCASWLVSNGAELRFVQDVLGHTSIRSTEIYSHLLPGATDRVAGAMDRVRTTVAKPPADPGPLPDVSEMTEDERERLLAQLLLARLQK